MVVKDRIKGLFQQAELVVFFFFLTTSLFWGDGKQPFVDVWWALGILTMYGARYYQRGKLDLSSLSRPIGVAWMALILYYVILTPFSDSAGYSITATIRLIEAFLVYVMFVAISSERTIGLFVKGLMFVGVVATLASFVFLFSPSLAGFLPPMNLLYAAYGHNHLADLLLPIFPLLIAQLQHKQPKLLWLLLTLFTVGMVLTFARGAWIILIGYLLFLFLRKKDARVKVIALVGAAALVIAPLLLSIVSTNKTTGGIFQRVPQISRLLQKQSFLEDGRWEYWRQAVEAIKERPLFGSGPGTFYLESKRLQVAPNSYSWFAHSFPLETMVEVGLVGTILLSLVLVMSLQRARASPLFAPLCLTLLYSFFEFNLDYAVVWALAWAILGLSFNDKKNNHQRHGKPHVFMVGGLVVLSVFYATYVSSIALDVVGKKKLSFYIAPYIVSTIKNYLEQVGKDKQRLSQAEERIVAGFYKKDSDVLLALARTVGASEIEQLKARVLYQEALHWDPKNSTMNQEYIFFLIDNNFYRDAFYATVRAYGQKTADRQVFLEPQFTEGIINTANKDQIKTTIKLSKEGLLLPKIFYLFGLSVLSGNPQATRYYWQFASDLAPSWNYFYVEQAALSFFAFYDQDAAQKQLQQCLVFINYDPWCTSLITNTYSLPQPGSQKESILQMQTRGLLFY